MRIATSNNNLFIDFFLPSVGMILHPTPFIRVGPLTSPQTPIKPGVPSCPGPFIVAILVSKQRVDRVDFLVRTHPETAQCHSERSEESTVNLEATRFFPSRCSGQAYFVPQTCPRAMRRNDILKRASRINTNSISRNDPSVFPDQAEWLPCD